MAVEVGAEVEGGSTDTNSGGNEVYIIGSFIKWCLPERIHKKQSASVGVVGRGPPRESICSAIAAPRPPTNEI